jgi:triacylglycerol lipase
MAPRTVRLAHQARPLPIWRELLFGVEVAFLRSSPVYWGFGVPSGDRSAVVVIPGLLSTDFHCAEFCAWLERIGYVARPSGVGRNDECPNLLLDRVAETVDGMYHATGKRVHVIGHSLGGLLALALAARMPRRVESVVTLSSPFRGIAAHPAILATATAVRYWILKHHGP